MLYLSLQGCNCLYKLPLLLEIGVADQLRVVKLDHLKLLSRCKLLLCQIFTLLDVGSFDFIDLAEVAFLIIGSLASSRFFYLVSKLDDGLGVI